MNICAIMCLLIHVLENVHHLSFLLFFSMILPSFVTHSSAKHSNGDVLKMVLSRREE